MSVAIIGACFGDEGKGLLTDYVASKHPGAVVMRYNGGAQAGHTVVTPDGRRHVFSHFGSGSFVSAPTFLTKHFVVNPRIFLSERAELQALGLTPHVLVDPECYVTTPYDVMINRWAEEDRTKRHGSCGIGFNETVERNARLVRLTVGRFASPRSHIINKLNIIRRDYAPVRLAELGINITPQRQSWLDSDDELETFLGEAEQFMAALDKGPNGLSSDDLIFEGAQGLLLDEHHRFFPHVTRSKPGLHNVMQLLGDRDLEVIYVTRAYMTRHGAGPFPTENGLSFPDATNVKGPFQGPLRFGILDVDLIAEAVKKDLTDACGIYHQIECVTLAITHLDQIDGEIKFRAQGRDRSLPRIEFTAWLSRHLGIRDVLLSFGPTRTDICKTERL